MGGTFDPIHYGHLILAEYVMTDMQLDHMMFIPSGTPYLKSEVTAKEHRLAMTKLGIQDNPKFKINTIEMERTGNTYTIDTIQTLIQSYPETDFYFVMGADSLFDLEKWKDSTRLFQICHFIVANRGGMYSPDTLNKEIRRLYAKYNARISQVRIPDIQISSTEIRNRVMGNQSIRYLLPETVEAYIRIHDIYQESLNLEVIKNQLKASLEYARYEHTLGVEETALSLASIHGVNPSKAQVAALLHDCAKHMSDDQVIKLCASEGIALTPEALGNPDLIHAKIGALMATLDYGVDDIDILNAITYHTTGRPKMSELEKVIYIADYIEPGRNKAPQLDYIRETAQKSLDEALFLIMRDTILYLESQHKYIDPLTREAYAYYKDQK